MQTTERLTAAQIVLPRDRVRVDDRRNRVDQPLLVFLLLLAAAVYIATAGVPRLFDQIDGQYAGAAREMLSRGDWLIPTQDGIPRLQKPPLVYWCEIGSLQLFGENEFAARFPVVLATISWFLVTAALVQRLSVRRIYGVCAALILATFLGTYLFTHLVMPEPFSALFFVCTFYALVCALQGGSGSVRDRWLLCAWALMALGTLTKGLHALLVPLVVGCASAALKKSTRETWRRFFFRPHGWILFLAMVAPWYVATELRYPGFLVDQLGNEQLGNILNQRWPVDSDRVPLLQFFLEHVALFFPWSFFIPGAVLTLWESRSSWLRGEWHLLVLFLLINVVGILFAKIQDYYLLISWPAVAIGVAGFFISGPKFSRPRLFSIPGWLFVVAGLAGLSVAIFWICHPLGTSQLVDTVTHGRTAWGGLVGISGLSGLVPLLLVASCTLALAGACIVYFARQSRSLAILGSCAGLMIVLFLVSNRGLYLVEDEFSSARIASTIQQLGGADYQVVCEFEANDLTSLFFYLPHSIQWLNANPKMEFATRDLGLGRDLYLTEERFQALWGNDQRIFLVARQDRLDHWYDRLQIDGRRMTPVATIGTKIILMNR
ncbi:MAG TPA: glycosyltransferase family 39 protein [Chthoniobacterales bacterium]|nr:glycosyltransferase family 39 protein [Chthoniobacterales bacterium]